jgi:hypothetical protein
MVNHRVEIIIGAVAVDQDLTTHQIHRVKVVLAEAEMVPKQDKPRKAERLERAVAVVLCAVMMQVFQPEMEDRVW